MYLNRQIFVLVYNMCLNVTYICLFCSISSVYSSSSLCVLAPLFLQFAPAGVVRPSDVLQQHPHASASLQPARSSLSHCYTPHTPHTPCTQPTQPTHTFSHPPLLSPSVPRSALHHGDAVSLPTQPLNETCLQVWICRFMSVCVCVCVCMYVWQWGLLSVCQLAWIHVWVMCYVIWC